MQKKLVQSSLAMTAAAALGLGGAFVASPAMADNAPQKLNVENDAQVQKALSGIEGVNAYGETDGKLNLGVEKKTDEIKELEKKFDNINIVDGIKELKPYAKKDLVGGAGYLANSPAGKGVCSTGFSGWDGEGNPVVLTAGHCSTVIDPATGEIGGDTKIGATEKPSIAEANGGEGFQPTDLGVVGEWGYHSYGSGDLLEGPSDDWTDPKPSDIDFAVINVDEDKYSVKNGVTDWTSADSDDLSKSLATEIAQVGAHKETTVEKSGRTTGLTEGEVIPFEEYPFEFSNVGGRWVHGFGVTSPESDPFSAPGDSGGAVFQGDTAVGVISGGGPAADGTQFGWVADLDYSLEQSGVDFQVEKPGEETPTPEAPAAPEAKDQTIEPNGDVTGKAEAGAEVEVNWAPAKGTQAAKEGSKTVKADEDGNFTVEGPEAEGDYDYSATAIVDEQKSEAAEFQVTVEKEETETPAPAEREINVDPKEIVASDFVKEDKGVTVSVKGFDEGEKVTLEAASGPENVEGITLDETANENGAAAFSIYGTSEADPAVYLGKYDVKVTGANDTEDEKALAGSFNVVEDEEGNGGGGNDGGDDGDNGNNDDDGNGDGGDGGSDLPRTGAELTGLAAGAGLLVVGGAAVVLTMRRNKKN
ncbi:LPXTG cell wall anchor domain-containing protein [Brevibacterium aurantiacum]|uniref:Peptidoglycan bound protein (LPXTG motif) n=1 Tax=Brevibacterium aurantiacum TaxID=273384 RepID=A0A1D7W314_BREAU|nr:LPXTG cell wall anchor domain-containing protein [Brevibacterium aurantiacum]AOP53334.1 Putative peptidoglycan bound protein (LPXTG motif) [Brevibacterium aurantiacum]RCS96885.1 LPXTG cell wall anchor domain-containing protein [Brevibacterium aurantiacum]